MKRTVFFIAAWLSLLIGIIGIFLPVLPTVPLILLSGYCFSRSSERFHNWITQHTYFGPIIEAYKDGKVQRSTKIKAITLLAISMAISIYVVPITWVKYILLTIGISVSLYLVSREEP